LPFFSYLLPPAPLSFSFIVLTNLVGGELGMKADEVTGLVRDRTGNLGIVSWFGDIGRPLVLERREGGEALAPFSS
jgi:hypothetical protein